MIKTANITLQRARRGGQGGFSIIELLVAIIIIGILVSVLIPVVSNRAEDARQARALSDLEIISEAQSRVAIDTGYYVRLWALNDRLRGDGRAFVRPPDPADTSEGLTDYITDTGYYSFLGGGNGLFIDPDSGDYARFNLADFINNRLILGESRYTGGAVWNGPYMNIVDDDNVIDGFAAPDGIPDDPWGNNYLLVTEEGVVREPDGVIEPAVNYPGFGNFDATVFDRAHIVTLGSNGLPGDGDPASTEGFFGRGDDFARPFGQ